MDVLNNEATETANSRNKKPDPDESELKGKRETAVRSD
jgi:hypothetical protein